MKINNFLYQSFLKKHVWLQILILLAIVFCVIIWAATQGMADITMMDSLKIILSKIPIINQWIDTSNISETSFRIVLNIRIPRILCALFAGIGLSMSGTVFQSVFKNPMADPFILGTASGATLGVTISSIFTTFSIAQAFRTPLFAFIFAILTVWVVYKTASIGNQFSITTLLLTGIAMNYLFSSFTTLLMLYNKNTLEKIYFRTLGSFNVSSYTEVLILMPVIIVCCIILYAYSKELNLMLLGEKDAQSLGVHVARTKKILILISSLMISVIIAFTGAIGFVGLIVPHMGRLLVGSNHKVQFIAVIWLGSVFMILCDTIARSMLPMREIPVGVITSLFGVPFFIYLLYKNKKEAYL